MKNKLIKFSQSKQVVVLGKKKAAKVEGGSVSEWGIIPWGKGEDKGGSGAS